MARKKRPQKLSKLIPTTWLDPLLTGPGAVIGSGKFYTCADIENLLRALKKRIEAAERSNGDN